MNSGTKAHDHQEQRSRFTVIVVQIIADVNCTNHKRNITTAQKTQNLDGLNQSTIFSTGSETASASMESRCSNPGTLQHPTDRFSAGHGVVDVVCIARLAVAVTTGTSSFGS